ncbi:MAG: lysophospholipid acyltransferase family protein [Desulfuromonadales bacterium]|nr:lysophospholipid acyltransferase family protein [Desulfuromonadales bacterium]
MKPFKHYRRKIASYLAGSLGSFLLYWIISLLFKTLRVRYIRKEVVDSLTNGKEGFIGAFWHGRMLLIPFIYPGENMNVLISVHRDGEIIANVMKRFGFSLVRGSSKKGGSEAMREILTLLKDGKDIAFTPDGPRGPREVLKSGVSEAARLSGKPLIPVAYSASPCFRATSWDGFMMPYPFSKAILAAGEPVYYQEGEEPELFRQRVEAALRKVTAEADSFAKNKRDA